MTQEASVYGDLTIAQNIRYFARILGAPTSDEDRVIEQVGLTDFELNRSDICPGDSGRECPWRLRSWGSPSYSSSTNRLLASTQY